MSQKKTELFLRFSTDPKKASSIADEYRYFHQNELREERVPSLSYLRYKEVFMPATHDFPKCMRFIYSEVLGRHSEFLMRGDRRARGKKTDYISGPVSTLYSDPIMEQAMERVRMSRLPCYAFARRSFTGWMDGFALTITLDSVTDCPPEMQGSYLTLSGYGIHNYSRAELRRASVSIVGATQVVEPGCDYEALLKQQHPKFPWTWKKPSWR